MAIVSPRWKAITQSEYAWEQEALQYIKDRLPDREPYRAWANFEFIADDGSINEVDLLVLTPQGFFIVEIKSRPGVLSGDSGTWTWQHDGRCFTDDNPLILTNRKAKKLASLLKRQKSAAKVRLPFLEAMVFCSAPDLDCKLVGNARYRICLRDRQAEGGRPARPGIIAAIQRRECHGLQEHSAVRIDAPMAKAVKRAMEQAGVRESQRKRRVSDYVLKQVIFEGRGYQDWEAVHVSLPDIERRIRIYPVRTTANADERRTIKRAAEREFQLLESLAHPGVLRAHAFSEHELGPVIVFEHQPAAMRFDHYLAERGQLLGPDHRLHFLRKISEVIQYAHQQRILHRALSPQSILVVNPATDLPVIKVFNWQTGYRAGGTSSLTKQVTATDHVDQLVEDASTAYMAPEALNGIDDSGEHVDVFSLGAIAYHLFAGRPPAGNALELSEKLRAEKGLQISSVLNGAGENLQFLIQYSTHPDVTGRVDSVRDFLEYLDAVEDELTTPESQKDTVADPVEAQAGDILAGRFRVIKRIGSGASSVAFLVEHQDRESILKIALNADHNDRLRNEAEVLQQLRHPRVIEYFETVEIGDRLAIRMRALTRRLKNKKVIETLRHWIRSEGQLQVDFLHRFGEDLLDAVKYLEEKGISHRDIKPDNLVVANIGSEDQLHLVAFDFSLSRAPADNIRVGTRAYLDPFLPLRKHKRWDLHAERWAAGVTLYEMATGQLPVWHDGKTDPSLVDCEFTLDAELFEPDLRDGLSRFFKKALRRDPDRRFDNAEQMLRAWRDVFEALDADATTSEHELETDQAALLETAGLETQIPELGLSTRSMNALDRLNIFTVEDLLNEPIRRLFRLRGVGQKTRREITQIVQALRDRLGTDETVPEGKDYDRAGSDGEGRMAEVISVDLLADRITKLRKSQDMSQKVIAALAGLDDTLESVWPTQAEVGRHFDITRSRVGQILNKAQDRWSRNTLLTALREEIAAILNANGGVMILHETADAILAARGSIHDEPLRSRLATAVIRGAVEVERLLVSPKFGVRREGELILISTQPALADYAIRLGKAADGLADEDPILPPARVLEMLREVPSPLEDLPIPNNRLIRLAAAASGIAAISSRQELYPRGMAAVRALKLSQGALLGMRQLTVDQIRQRVAGRYPEAEPLPGPPALDRLLKEAGLELKRDAAGKDGKLVYRSPSHETLVPLSSTSQVNRYATDLSHDAVTPQVTEEIADARQFEERLVHHRQAGGFMALSVTPKWYLQAIATLKRRFDPALFDMEKAFLTALRETAREKKVKWEKVIEADASPPESLDWQRLLQLVRLAMPRVESQLWAADDHMLIVFGGVLARYDQMGVIDDLRERTGRSGSAGGIPGVWLLIPGDEQSALPKMEGRAVPVISSGQHARIPESWLKNVHRAKASVTGQKTVKA